MGCTIRLKFALVHVPFLDNGKKEDVRCLWAALAPTGYITDVSFKKEEEEVEEVVREFVERNDDEAGWTRLCQIMDMSEEDWALEINLQAGEEVEGRVEGMRKKRKKKKRRLRKKRKRRVAKMQKVNNLVMGLRSRMASNLTLRK